MDGESEVAKRGERIAAILGHVVWLMSLSPKHKHLTLADMDWLVVPALLHRQFKLYRLDGKPFAYASWAYVSLDVVQRVAVEGGICLQVSGCVGMRPGWSMSWRRLVVQRAC